MNTRTEQLTDMESVELSILSEEPIQEPKQLSDLGWMARIIKQNQKQIALIKDYEAREIEKLSACVNLKCEALQAESDRLQTMAELLMKENDYCYENKHLRKYLMPGTGVFRFSVTRESVDTSQYDDMHELDKEALQEQYTCFSIKTTITPDKKKIVTLLKEGGDVPDAFKLKPKFEKFEFKGE